MRIHLSWVFVVAVLLQPTLFIKSILAESPRSVVQAKGNSEEAEIREFEVRVDNTTRGTHRLKILSENDQLNVDVQTDVRVDLIVYAYVFKFRGTEVWRDGRVLQSDIRCEDGSKKRSFSLKTDEGVQQVSYNGKPVKSSEESVLTTAYWHLPHADVRSKLMTIADVDTGRILNATFTEVGPDTVTAGSRKIDCRHFKIDGPSPAELWFDNRDRLVWQKSVEQGHAMELRLKSIRIAKEEP